MNTIYYIPLLLSNQWGTTRFIFEIEEIKVKRKGKKRKAVL